MGGILFAVVRAFRLVVPRGGEVRLKVQVIERRLDHPSHEVLDLESSRRRPQLPHLSPARRQCGVDVHLRLARGRC
eukprot:scaffold17871_cov82-Phaeocystis_antarctica.AAC.4